MKRIAIVVAGAVVLAAVGAYAVEHHRRKPTAEPVIVINRVESSRYNETTSSPLFFALIIGSDVRSGDPTAGRSDSLHIVALDTRTGHGTIIGIPRDSYVNIPGHGVDKINASLDLGGPALTVKTVSQLSGIPIQYWAIVDFSRFRKLVDTLGGVDVNVPTPMHDSFSGADFGPGPHHLNGPAALAFARDRHSFSDGDFTRSGNQGRLLLDALVKFRKDAASPLRLVDYFRAFGSLVRSNVPVAQLIKLAELGRRADPNHVANVVVPGAGGNAGGASVVFLAPGAQDLFRKVRERAVL
jgi:LCP family protein required for cell wall assembly